MRHTIAIVLLVTLGACKGETVTKPDPQTSLDLDACKKTLAEKDKLIKAEEDENARLMREKTTGGEIVITAENNILTIKPSAPGQAGPPVDPTAAKKAYAEFMDVVGKSRGAIQKCYEGALKKDSNLQAHTVTLTIKASFGDSGAFKDMSSDPSINPTFDSCLKTVASKWSVSQATAVKNFKAPVSLTPS
jgi:hypothetical protein